jgi:hypothetical protein
MMRPIKVPKPCEAKDEEEREQEQEAMKGQKGPGCLKEKEWEDFLGRRNQMEKDSQAKRREGEELSCAGYLAHPFEKLVVF